MPRPLLVLKTKQKKTLSGQMYFTLQGKHRKTQTIFYPLVHPASAAY